MNRSKKLKVSPNRSQSRTSKEGLLRAARALRDIPSQADITAFLNLKVPITDADLNAVENFLRAAQVMKEVPEYKTMIRKRTEQKHCVRCHEEYTEETNLGNACKIPHAFSDEMEFFGKMASYEERIYTHTSLCCEGVELDEDGHKYVNLNELGLCFEGKHTTQEITVECGKGNGYNDINIRECVVDPDMGRCVLRTISNNPMILTSE